MFVNFIDKTYGMRSKFEADMILGLYNSATSDMDCSLSRCLSIHRAIAGNVQLDTAADCNLNLGL